MNAPRRILSKSGADARIRTADLLITNGLKKFCPSALISTKLLS
jgi:hypothetical protein